MKTKILLFLTIIATILFVVSCGSVPAEKVCEVDADCTAALCCHSDDSVNKDNAPDCQGILCSTECVPGTMDCGQASAKCVQGACTVVER